VSAVPQYSAGDASLAAAGGIVVVTRITEGTIIVDASDVGRMRELTRVGTELPGISYRLAAAEHRAYVSDGRVLRVVDVSDPANPAVAGSHSVAGSYSPPTAGRRIADVAVQGARLYLLAEFGNRHELHVLDVTNASAPRRIALFDLGEETPGGLVVRGDYAYIAAQFHDAATSTPKRRLHVLDVSTPSAPRLVGDLEMAKVTRGGEGYPELAQLDKHLLLRIHRGLLVVDVSDLTHPTVMGRLDTSYDVGAVAASGTRGYIAFSAPGGLETLSIVDISDPTTPRITVTEASN